jgi:hypothetical protein
MKEVIFYSIELLDLRSLPYFMIDQKTVAAALEADKGQRA